MSKDEEVIINQEAFSESRHQTIMISSAQSVPSQEIGLSWVTLPCITASIEKADCRGEIDKLLL